MELKKREWEMIERTFLFRGLPLDALEKVLTGSKAQLIEYAAGEVILSPRVFTPLLGILLEGKATVYKEAPAGGGMLMSILEPGAMFGAAALFRGGSGPYPTQVRAAVASRAIVILEEDLKAMFAADFRLTDNYLQYLTGRIDFLTGRIESFLCPTVEERLLLFLSGASDANGEVKLAYSYTALAQALSVGRASLYRALDALEAQGRIKRGSGRYIQLMPRRAQMAEQED